MLYSLTKLVIDELKRQQKADCNQKYWLDLQAAINALETLLKYW